MCRKKNSKNQPNDIIAQAQSGTGKTGAFSISALQLVDDTIKQTQVIILSPTHELAGQTHAVIQQLGVYMDIQCLKVIGKTSVQENIAELKKNPHIIVGTPGRTYDMIERGYLKTKNVRLIICDEADEMLSKGFSEQIYNILQHMPNEVQIGLFSATMPEGLDDITNTFMQEPTKILVKRDALTLRGIVQYFINVRTDNDKYDTLQDIFKNLSISQTIIYCNSTRRVDDLYEAMNEEGYPVERMHGKLDTEERKRINNDFKQGKARVLISSDVYARGIDVQQVSIVINFDIPKDEATYLHRIGRSGRWGRKGVAINFQTGSDIAHLKRIEEYYQTEIREMPQDFTAHISNV